MKAALLLPLLVLAAPANAVKGDQGEEFQLRFDCGKSMCTIVKEDLGLLLQHNTEFFDRMKKAEDALAKDPPVCAKTEVTEPSKNAPPQPKPPPKPPIKPENNT